MIIDDYIGKVTNSWQQMFIDSSYKKLFRRIRKISTYRIWFYCWNRFWSTKSYLKSKGVDLSYMTLQEIKEANTGSKVFLKQK